MRSKDIHKIARLDRSIAKSMLNTCVNDDVYDRPSG
jgi:hypothetical protein